MNIKNVLILLATLASISSLSLQAAAPRYAAPAFWVCNECQAKNRSTAASCAVCGEKSPAARAAEEDEKWFSEFIEKKREETEAAEDAAWLQELLAKHRAQDQEKARSARAEAERQAQAAEEERLRQLAEEQLEAERLEQLRRLQEEAQRAKAAIKAAREAAAAEAARQRDAATKPSEAPASAVPLSPRPVGLRNDSGTCFINAMLQCVFSSTRLMNEIKACGSATPITGMLNTLINEYYYHGITIPEMLISLLGDKIRELFTPGEAARDRGSGGDPYHTYQALTKHISTINPAFKHEMMHVYLPDESATPVRIKALIEAYEYRINKKASVLVFSIARRLVGRKLNNKPVILAPEITLDGVRFRLTGFTVCPAENHVITERISADGWFSCNDAWIEKITPDFSKGHAQVYMVMYERI